jgi:hypothetical protein
LQFVKTKQLTQFRYEVYQNFNKCKRTDTLMDLVDALSSNTNARTVVELTLNPHFRRHYSALNKAVAVSSLTNPQLAHMASQSIGELCQRKYYVLGTDVTSNPRPYAQTLPDRGFVYQPNTIKGNKPIVIGHQYSLWAFLPEPDQSKSGHWVAPLSMQRVASQENKELVGAKQLGDLLADESLPFGSNLCVEVADSAYSKPAYLHANREHKNLVTIVRARGTRTFYHPPVPGQASAGKGHPTWYGTPFNLQEPETWGTPDQVAETTFVSHKKIHYRVENQAWHNLLMRGGQGKPMHQHPFTLARIRFYNHKGEALFQKPLWLIVMGDRRMELSLLDIYQAYLQRYDLEHFFRFGKQKLLLDKFQTPDDKHEEHWWRLVALAYLQLWIAKDLTRSLPRPWERYLPICENQSPTPAMALRDMSRIIRQIGTPASAPKPRGKSPGRRKGVKLTPRSRKPVMKKASA